MTTDEYLMAVLCHEMAGRSPITKSKREGEMEPRFSTQWEREDYEREKRGDTPLGPSHEPCSFGIFEKSAADAPIHYSAAGADAWAAGFNAAAELWSARLTAVVQTAGGMVEGRPTGSHNILQRIRELVGIEEMSDLECLEYAVQVVLRKLRECDPSAMPTGQPSPQIVMNWLACALREAKEVRGEKPLGCNHWPGQKRCEVCGMGWSGPVVAGDPTEPRQD